MLLIRVFDRGVEEEDRDSNTATTFIRQKEGWISDEISQWTYYINTYAVMPFQKIEVTAHYLSVRVKKECCVGIISTIILKGFFEVHYSSPPHHLEVTSSLSQGPHSEICPEVGDIPGQLGGVETA